jgi:predicted nucleic acid-binding protein
MASSEPLALTPLILTEVLQGIRDDRSFEVVRNTLEKFPTLDLDRKGHVEAARLFRRLRKAGITIRGTIDVLIAQTCLERNCPILSPDRDFAAIAKHSALRLCAV